MAPNYNSAWSGSYTALPTSSTSYRSSRLAYSQRQTSCDDTAYNGSEGLIHEDDLEDTTAYCSQPGPSVLQSSTPTRQPLSARLLSAVSNAQPAAAALTRKGSLLHTRARSLAAYVPKLNPTVESVADRRESNPNKIFGDLFSGESAPVRIGALVSPTKELEETEFVMEYRPTFTERPFAARRRDIADSLKTTNSNVGCSRPTGWFGRRSTVQLPQSTRVEPPKDDLLSMDINTCLFPDGPPDPLDPAAFNDLLLNATQMLQRMQTAYKNKTDYITSMRPELDAQKEEVEEAETRSQHLKIQLQDMSRRAQEQEAMLKEMTQVLAAERARGHEPYQHTVRMVQRSSSSLGELGHEPQHRRKRTSADSVSDSGFESDSTETESLFSHSSGTNDTTFTPPSASRISDVETENWNLSQPKRETRSMNPNSPNPRNSMWNEATISTSTALATGKHLGSEGAAWATVEVLRSENCELKNQLQEMRQTLQGCIDFVSDMSL